MFPDLFVKVLIIGALVMTALSAVVLVALLISDLKKGRLW